ncbi:MAG: hypothetical protein HY704_01275 [Gemmatimonadetes bacterium]|nr:hypothetical protein [Gemmatimonadota bacterium]
MRVRCFGELEIVRADGSDVLPIFMLPRRAALFLYLLLSEPPIPIPRRELAEMFWPFQAPGAAERALDESLFTLRQYLGEVWEAADDGVVIVPDPLWCDVWAFREALATGDLERATGLYRGPLLERPPLFGAGEFQVWLEQQREGLQQAALASFARLAEREARAGNWQGAARIFREAARTEPLEEANLRCLMVALVQAGERPGALRAYDLLKRRLALRHGRTPEDETDALAEVIGRGATPPLAPFLPD